MNSELQTHLQQLLRLQTQQLEQNRIRESAQTRQWEQIRQQFQQSLRPAQAEMSFASNEQQMNGMSKSFQRILREMGKQFEGFAKDGEINISRLKQSFSRMLEQILQQMLKSHFPSNHGDLAGHVVRGMGTILGGIFHEGGTVSESSTNHVLARKDFQHAPRLHNGGRLGLGLGPSEFPAILQRGETVVPQGKTQKSSHKVDVHIHNAPAGTRTETSTLSDGSTRIDVMLEHIESHLSGRLSRGDGLAGILENRYSLSPSPNR